MRAAKINDSPPDKEGVGEVEFHQIVVVAYGVVLEIQVFSGIFILNTPDDLFVHTFESVDENSYQVIFWLIRVTGFREPIGPPEADCGWRLFREDICNKIRRL